MTDDGAENWNESEHPRDEKGQFSKTEGRDPDDEGSFYNTSVFVDNATWAEYNAEMKGTVTSQGTRINEVTGHATGRMIEREFTSDMVKDILTAKDSDIKPGKTKRTTCYEKDRKRFVVDHVAGRLVTVMHIWEDW